MSTGKLAGIIWVLDEDGLDEALKVLAGADRRTAILYLCEVVIRVLPHWKRYMYEKNDAKSFVPNLVLSKAAQCANGKLRHDKAKEIASLKISEYGVGDGWLAAAVASAAFAELANVLACPDDHFRVRSVANIAAMAAMEAKAARSPYDPDECPEERRWQEMRLREVCAMGGYPPSEPTEGKSMLTPATCAIIAQYLEQERNRFARWLHNHGEPGEADKIISAMREVGRDGYRNNNLFGMPYWIYGDTLYWIGGHSLYCAGVDTIFINYEAEDNTS
jgi:hypothetical protein